MRSPVIYALFRFYAELNDFLPERWRQREFRHPLAVSDTLKHVIESLGVPHTEVHLILLNGIPAGWSAHLSENDRVSIYPALTRLCAENNPLTADNTGQRAFVLDGHLGRLAAYLRMLGFDCVYHRTAEDEQLAEVAAQQDRILLTRDVGLLKRRNVRRGHFVRADDPRVQLRDIVLRYDLLDHVRAFSRCMECNGVLAPVRKDVVADRLPPHTRETKDQFSLCADCGKVYWRGSHHSEMSGWIDQLLHLAPASR